MNDEYDFSDTDDTPSGAIVWIAGFIVALGIAALIGALAGLWKAVG